MLRLWVAGVAAMLALLGGLGGVALAQDDVDDPRVTQFTGTITEERWLAGPEQEWVEDDVYHARGMVAEWTVEWTDPRLPSQMWHRIDYEEYLRPESALPYATSMLLLGEEGSWTGTGRGVGYDEGFVQYVLVGEGAYDGHYAILDRKDATLPDDTARRTFDGFIVEGDLTPMPDPVEPATAEPDATTDEAAMADTEAAADDDNYLAGTMTFMQDIDPGTSTERGSLLEVRGASAAYDLRMSDPRVSGTLTTLDFALDGYGGHRMEVGGEVELVTPDGTWKGNATGVFEPTMGWQILYRLDGQDGLDGQTFFLHATSPELRDGVWAMDGFVVG